VTQEELTDLINTAFNAVQDSKAGPVRAKVGDTADVIYNLGHTTFLHVLDAILPRSMTMQPPKEPWQE
jgi:hypothetical protein